MRSITGICRAGWVGALAAVFLAAGLVIPGLALAEEPQASGAAEAAKEAAKAAATAAKEAAQEAIEQAKAAAAQAGEQAQEAAKAAADEAQDAAREAADEARLVIKRIQERRLGLQHSDYHLGIHVAPVPKALDAQLGLSGEGVLVDRVTADGPADKAGIKQHDLILKVGDESIKSAADLLKVIAASEGKEIELQLLRAAKPMTVKATPTKALIHGLSLEFPTEEVEVEVRKLEEKIRDKLKDAGVDVRMQLVRPGEFVPHGLSWTAEKPEFPEDLVITVRKQGKAPAEIEVKQGDKSWTVKENELDKLPEEVRRHVEPYLGHMPGKFMVALPGGKKFNVAVPVPPVAPILEDGEVRVPMPGVQTRERARGSLERRIEELSRDMEKMSERMEALRRSLREQGEPVPLEKGRKDR
jgi:membrane-associated protease RseP (regulator of RpoE activity)